MEAGQILHGRYALLESINSGNMGEVWKARDLNDSRDVAIKGVKPGDTAVPGLRRRLQLEAETLKSLRHDRIVNILDEFQEGGELYIVMQLIPGPNLERAVAATHFSDASKVSILIDVLEALVYLHDVAEVVHRDLKPANILLDQEQRAYVTDFGIARGPRDFSATRTMNGIGSWSFAAPEVRAGKPATERSDVWSFGAVALWLFTNKLFDEGIPDGNFAGPLTEDIRAALSPRRPPASDLLVSFRTAEREGLTGPFHAARHDGETRAVPKIATAGAAAPAVRAVQPMPSKGKRGKGPGLLVLAGVVLVFLGAAAVWVFLPNLSPNGDPGPTNSASSFPLSVPQAPSPSVSRASPSPPPPSVSTPRTDLEFDTPHAGEVVGRYVPVKLRGHAPLNERVWIAVRSSGQLFSQGPAFPSGVADDVWNLEQPAILGSDAESDAGADYDIYALVTSAQIDSEFKFEQLLTTAGSDIRRSPDVVYLASVTVCRRSEADPVVASSACAVTGK